MFLVQEEGWLGTILNISYIQYLSWTFPKELYIILILSPMNLTVTQQYYLILYTTQFKISLIVPIMYLFNILFNSASNQESCKGIEQSCLLCLSFTISLAPFWLHSIAIWAESRSTVLQNAFGLGAGEAFWARIMAWVMSHPFHCLLDTQDRPSPDEGSMGNVCLQFVQIFPVTLICSITARLCKTHISLCNQCAVFSYLCY